MRRLPTRRFFPVHALVGAWLSSSTLRIELIPISDGTAATPETQPAYQAVAGGGRHLCGLDAAGVAHCWGDNDRGQVDAQSGRFTAISAGERTTCGLRTDGTILCWGRQVECVLPDDVAWAIT